MSTECVISTAGSFEQLEKEQRTGQREFHRAVGRNRKSSDIYTIFKVKMAKVAKGSRFLLNLHLEYPRDGKAVNFGRLLVGGFYFAGMLQDLLNVALSSALLSLPISLWELTGVFRSFVHLE